MKKSFTEILIGKSPKPIAMKLALLCFLAIVVGDIIQPFFDKDTKYIMRVKASDALVHTHKKIKEYPSTEILPAGVLTIKNPDPFDRLMYKTNETSSLVTSLSYLIILVVLLKYADKLRFDDKQIFSKNIWRPVLIIGLILFFLSIINIVKDLVAIRQVKEFTNGEFIPDERFTHWVQFWAGVILMNFSIVFKRGSELQQEQDLTV
jgi:hypothetical protein